MKDESVHHLLKQLHGALDDTTKVSEQDRDLLKALAEDIEAILARSGDSAEQGDQSFAERLRGALARFEVSHPDLTAAMSAVSKRLSDMGI